MTVTTGCGPTAAERIRSAFVRGQGTLQGEGSLLAVAGLTPTATPVHHVLADGSVAVAAPVDHALAGVAVGGGKAGVPTMLELIDYAPLSLRDPVRMLVWAWGTLHQVPLPAAGGVLDAIAAEDPNPALLQIDTAASAMSTTSDDSEPRYQLLRLQMKSVVISDTTGAEPVAVDAVHAARPDPFSGMESYWLRHLESDHPDVVARLASRLPKSPRHGDVRPLGLDRYGMRFRVEGTGGDHDTRLTFPRPVDDVPGLSKAIRVLMGCPFRNGIHPRCRPA